MDEQGPDRGRPGRAAGFAGRLGARGLIALGAGVLVGTVLVLTAVQPDEHDSSTPTSPSSTAPEAAGPLVAPIDTCGLLSDDEIDNALGLVDEQGTLRTDGVFTFERGEACRWEAEFQPSGAQVYLEIGPGDPADFAPQARLLDAVGVSRSGVGDLAVWFPGADAGAMSAVANTSNGYLFVRVEIGRAEVDDQTRRQLAADLAKRVMDRIRFGPPTPVEVDLCQLISDESAERYLAPHREKRPGAREEVFGGGSPKVVDLVEDGETSCQKQILTEIYVSASMGSSSDFAANAQLRGITGQPVDGVGDEAVLFEDLPFGGAFAADHEGDVLAVRAGDARFRIVAALPDLSVTDQRQAVRLLAHEALAQLPGGIPVTRTEIERPDVSALGFADNLEARVAEGEWTVGEGLVATLRLFVGEIGADQVLRQPELVNDSGTEIMRLARAYVETGPDAEAREQIRRLLGLLALPPYVDRDEEPSARRVRPSEMTVSLGVMPLAQIQGEEPDGGYAPPPDLPEDDPDLPPHDDPWDIGQCNYGPGPGWESVPAYIGEGAEPSKALVFIPESGLTPGWTETHLVWTTEAVQETLDVYNADAAPCIHLVLSVHPGASSWVLDTNASGICGVFLNTPMQGREEAPFKQEIARDLAHCIIPVAWPDQLAVASFLNRRWWNHALAEFLSNVVYPDPTCQAGRCDLEWRHTSALAALELTDPMMFRHDANWMFFQHIWWHIGLEGVVALVNEIPGSSNPLDHEKAMAGLDGMSGVFHEFVQGLTDVSIQDPGGGSVPYSPPSEAVPVSGAQVIPRSVAPFGTVRLHLIIEPGKFACISGTSGDDVTVTYREGRPGASGGGWQPLSEDQNAYSGELVVVMTTTEPDGDVTLTVSEVRDDDECEDEVEPGAADRPELPCLDFCGPSDYYRDPGQLDDSFNDRIGGGGGGGEAPLGESARLWQLDHDGNQSLPLLTDQSGRADTKTGTSMRLWPSETMRSHAIARPSIPTPARRGIERNLLVLRPLKRRQFIAPVSP